MLFYNGLEDIIFCRHEVVEADELIILSGYVGPRPVQRLQELPFNSTVIYGMYGESGIGQQLHDLLIHYHNDIENVNIYYSNTPIHSKCYAWKNEGQIVHALVGSANFTSNGLSTPYREILAETTRDTFGPLADYIQRILNDSVLCSDASVTLAPVPIPRRGPAQPFSDICRMTLLTSARGYNDEVPTASGLNWGHSPVAHVTPDDAYIPILTEYIRSYPNLFPPKQDFSVMSNGRGRATRHNDKIDIIWDDGATMEGLLEGNRTINGVLYPKQISSFPEKSILGAYIRSRLGVPSGTLVTRRHLENYGRTHIDVSLQGEGIYYFDFSVNA